MKRRAQARIAAELAGLTSEQQLAYWQKKDEEFRARRKELQQKQPR